MSLLGIDMAPRAHRRWLVAVTYVVLLVAAVVVWERGSNAVPLMVLATVVNGFVLGGYGRNGLIKPFVTRPGRASRSWRNDERELNVRDRAHFDAYRVVLAVFLLGVVLPENPFHYPQAGRALVLLGIVIGLTLPQALVLWTEPDVDLEESEVQSASPVA